jgi:Ca2+-transporting ATPase
MLEKIPRPSSTAPTMLAKLSSVSVMSAAFGTYQLTGTDWLVVTAAAATIIPVLDITKWLIRKYFPLKTEVPSGVSWAP